MKEKSKYNAQIEYAKRKKFVKIGFDSTIEIRNKFHKACESNNTTATKVLKDFVNNYIEQNEVMQIKQNKNS